MDIEQRRSLALAILLGSIILFAIIYYFWGNLINRGTILINADAPYTVEMEDGSEVECPVDICEIKSKSGLRDLILKKERHNSILESVNVKLWRRTELSVDFKIDPYLEQIESSPPPLDVPDYELIDSERGQALIKSGDLTRKSFAFFNDEITNPKIFPGENSLLIIDTAASVKPAYRVNLLSSERTLVGDGLVSEAVSGLWSPNGKYFVFSTDRSGTLWLLDAENNISELDLRTGIDQLVWSSDNKLLFATRQVLALSGSTFEDSQIRDYYFFGLYDPERSYYSILASFSEISSAPRDLLISANNSAVYFQLGRANYKITLK